MTFALRRRALSPTYHGVLRRASDYTTVKALTVTLSRVVLL